MGSSKLHPTCLIFYCTEPLSLETPVVPSRQHRTRTRRTRMTDKTCLAACSSNEMRHAPEMTEGTAWSMIWWTINHLAARHVSYECTAVLESPACERVWGPGSFSDSRTCEARGYSAKLRNVVIRRCVKTSGTWGWVRIAQLRHSAGRRPPSSPAALKTRRKVACSLEQARPGCVSNMLVY